MISNDAPRLYPKKRLGQNFLIDKNIRRKIIDAGHIDSGSTVLEIGAGRGEITTLIAEKAHWVIAVEIDPSLCVLLRETTKQYGNVEILNQDILECDISALLKKGSHRAKVVGNIPYYITTPIIERLFQCRDSIEAIFLLVQKEFAARITAKSGSKEYGALSCFIQYYTIPKTLFRVSKTCFRPVPKVDSAFLRFEVRERPPVVIEDEALLFAIIRAAFNQRRKTLRNSLRDVISPQKLDSFFIRYKIPRNTRPEMLALSDFARLAGA